MTNPKPIKFEEDEDALIRLLKAKHGISSYGDVVRRCVRFLGEEIAKHPEWDWVQATAHDVDHEMLSRMIDDYERQHGKLPAAARRSKTKGARHRQEESQLRTVGREVDMG